MHVELLSSAIRGFTLPQDFAFYEVDGKRIFSLTEMEQFVVYIVTTPTRGGKAHHFKIEFSKSVTLTELWTTLEKSLEEFKSQLDKN